MLTAQLEVEQCLSRGGEDGVLLDAVIGLSAELLVRDDCLCYILKQTVRGCDKCPIRATSTSSNCKNKCYSTSDIHIYICLCVYVYPDK